MQEGTHRLILVALVFGAITGLAVLRPEASLVEIGSVGTVAALFVERLMR